MDLVRSFGKGTFPSPSRGEIFADLSQLSVAPGRVLRQTGDLPLVEDSPKDPTRGWGQDRSGRNELGKIWMRLREEL